MIFVIVILIGVIKLIWIGMLAQKRLGHPGIIWALAAFILDVPFGYFLIQMEEIALKDYNACTEYSSPSECLDERPYFVDGAPGTIVLIQSFTIYAPVILIMLIALYTWPRSKSKLREKESNVKSKHTLE